MISVNAVKDSNGDLYATSNGLLVVDNVAVGILIDVNNNIILILMIYCYLLTGY